MREVERQPNPRDPVKVYKYYYAGENFKSYEALPHETVFLNAFRKSPNMGLLFRNLVRVGYENAHSERRYSNILLNGANVKPCFHNTFFARLLGNVNHTEFGLLRQKEIETEIRNLEQTIAKDSSQNRKIIDAIGGNVFLLAGVSLAVANELDQLFREESWRDAAGYVSGCIGSYENYSDDFDNSCSTPGDSDGGGGCGDSGCSGCGGCGGD